MEEASLNQKKKKSALRVVIEWVIYLAVLAGLVLGTPRVLSKALDTPYPIATVTSASMWPVLKVGDIIFIKGVRGKADIGVGDIVVYQNVSLAGMPTFTIHRVKSLSETTFVTKGDANNAEDSPVGYDKLVGKTVNWKNSPLRIPWLGKLSGLIKR